MATYSKSVTTNCNFHNYGAESTLRALAVVAVPGQPVFSQIVGFQMSNSYSQSLTSTYTSSQITAKNANRHYHITTTATFVTGSQGPT